MTKFDDISFLIPINAVTNNQLLTLNKYINNNKLNFTIVIMPKCILGYTFFNSSDLDVFVNITLKLNEKYIYWFNSINFENTYNLDLDLINRNILNDIRKNKLNNIKDIFQ